MPQLHGVGAVALPGDGQAVAHERLKLGEIGRMPTELGHSLPHVLGCCVRPPSPKLLHEQNNPGLPEEKFPPGVELDLEGCFRGRDLERFCAERGIELAHVPAENHASTADVLDPTLLKRFQHLWRRHILVLVIRVSHNLVSHHVARRLVEVEKEVVHLRADPHIEGVNLHGVPQGVGLLQGNLGHRCCHATFLAFRAVQLVSNCLHLLTVEPG